MTWKDNPIMFWWDATAGAYKKVTDHNRSPLSVTFESIERKQRMANGTMRKYVVARKRSWSCSWEMVPSTNSQPTGLQTVDGGMAGEDIEAFYKANTGAFNMQLHDGDGGIETVLVMISDFSKEIEKRGPRVDLWNIDITLEEV